MAAAFGLLVPASNRVMEQDFRRWLPEGARLNVNRLNAPRERPDDMRENLVALTTGVEECARLLDLAGPDVIAFGCTSGSFLEGRDWEARIAGRIRSAARAREVVVTARAAVDALRALGATRIAVGTPYPETINRLLRTYLEQYGFEIVSFEAVDGWKTGTIANLAPQVALDLVDRSDYSRADAIFLSCTNFRAGEVLEEIEQRCGKPVVTANQATFWASARVLGLDEAMTGLGALGRCR
jgi:maleate cis-trans isomerase